MDNLGSHLMYYRCDLEKTIGELEKEVSRYSERGDTANADRIASIVSRHSQALNSNVNVYRDNSGDTCKTYWLARASLLGGGGETLEDSKRFFQAGEVFYNEGKLPEALEQYQKSLEIRKRVVPNSLYVAYAYNNVGKVLADQGKFQQALECFGECLEFLNNLDPRCFAILESLNVELLRGYVVRTAKPGDVSLTSFYAISYADTRNRIGNVYQLQEKLNEALEQHQRSRAIQEFLDPKSMAVANSYQNIGNVYYSQGRLNEALIQYQESLAIKKCLASGSLSVADSYCCIGNVYQDQGKFSDALEQYLTGLDIQERLATNSLIVAKTCNNMGNVYSKQRKLSEALKYYRKSIDILKRLDPKGLSTAYSYMNIGNVYSIQGKLDDAMDQYLKGLPILKSLVPNSLSLATSYKSIGFVYAAQGNSIEALNWFKESYNIQKQKLNPKHPDLLFLENTLAKTALDLSEPDYYAFAVALTEKIIRNDPSYKYAYDTLGLARYKQGFLDKALTAFDRALACDPGYADASIHRLEIIAAISRQTNDFSNFADECSRANGLKKTDYDEKKKRELEAVAKESRTLREGDLSEGKVELPKTELEAGTAAYTQQIANIQRQLNEHSNQLQILRERVHMLEERVDILDGRMLELKDSLSIIKSATDVLDQKRREMSPTDPLLQKLMYERRKLEEREQLIKSFNRDPDQRHYYNAFLSEFERAYMAAQVMATEKFVANKSEIYGKAADYVENYLKLIPVVGEILSKGVIVIAGLADMRNTIRGRIEFMRILNLASSLESFDQIAIRLAVECTCRNRNRIALLRGERVPDDWKMKVRSFRDGGVEGLMTQFLKDNETLAKVLGRCDAYKAIAHLQQEAVSENYATLEDDGDDKPFPRRKASLISLEIAETVVKVNASQSIEEGHSALVASPKLSPKLSDGLSIQLSELIDECKQYTAATPEKIIAIRALQTLLERRLIGPFITTQAVLNHINAKLNSDDPIFAERLLGNTVRKIFEKARECMGFILIEEEFGS